MNSDNNTKKYTYWAADMDEGIRQMVGKTFVSAQGDQNSETLVFIAEDGTRFEFYHEQDCCESVYIEDVNGDLQDLMGSPMLRAEESTSQSRFDDDNDDINDSYNYGDSYTWTFYVFATIKGSVTVRWLGTSNGYYSESVSLRVITPAP